MTVEWKCFGLAITRIILSHWKVQTNISKQIILMMMTIITDNTIILEINPKIYLTSIIDKLLTHNFSFDIKTHYTWKII